MRRTRTRILLACVAAAAVIAGVLVAVTSPAGHGHANRTGTHVSTGAIASADIAAAARYLGIDPAKLRNELRRGQTLATLAERSSGHSAQGLAGALAAAKAARLRAAAREGRLSTTAAQAQLATVTARAQTEVRRARPIAGLGGSLAPAAHYLKISRGKLLSQIRSGRSLAEIAAQHKQRSAAGLLQALVAARSARIAAAVRLGALSSSEASELRATLRRRMSRLVYRSGVRGH
jgi:hypothetical protein